MRAFAGKRPAIMKREHDGFVSSAEKAQKRRHIYIVVMQVMQMYNVRVLAPYIPDGAHGAQNGKPSDKARIF
jgi:hypothetical protein